MATLRKDCISVVMVYLFLSALSYFSPCLVQAQATPSQPKDLPPFFIFGDSLVDPGNNNYLPATLARANFPNNGIDFKDGPTGRFCNGRTVLDVLCDIVNIPYLPPYMAPETKAGKGILGGVNYASAAGGILDASGGNYVERISMNQQIGYFKNTLAQLQLQLGGAPQAATFLGKSIATFVIGNNDFINNYLLSDTTTKLQYSVRSFNILLLNTLGAQLTELYGMGFRKYVVTNIGPLGCIPDQLAIAKTTTCIGTTNAQIQDYNTGLASLVSQLNTKYLDATFLYANIYDSVTDVVQNPAQHGFQVTNQGCCGSGLYNGQLPCLPNSNLCPDRSAYIFWDPYHTTDAMNVILANRLYSGGPDRIYPINIQQLINQSQ